METSHAPRLVKLVHAANEATAAETVHVTTSMTEQCKRLTELGRELVGLCDADPETLTGDACGDRALLIAEKRKAIAAAINELAVQPVVTIAWAKAYVDLYSAEAPFQHRYSEWYENQKAEEERQERAATYRDQCHREQAIHEQRLRGELV